VALEYMETKYGNSEFVDGLAGGILVYAGGDVDRASAFVQVRYYYHNYYCYYYNCK
jgi:hypothetical protein